MAWLVIFGSLNVNHLTFFPIMAANSQRLLSFDISRTHVPKLCIFWFLIRYLGPSNQFLQKLSFLLQMVVFILIYLGQFQYWFPQYAHFYRDYKNSLSREYNKLWRTCFRQKGNEFQQTIPCQKKRLNNLN